MIRRLRQPERSELFNDPDLVEFRRCKIIAALHEAQGSPPESLPSESANGNYFRTVVGVSRSRELESNISKQDQTSWSKGEEMSAHLSTMQAEIDKLKADEEKRRNQLSQIIHSKNIEIQSLLAQLIQAKLDVAQKHAEFDELEVKYRSIANELENSKAIISDLRASKSSDSMRSRPSSEKFRESISNTLNRIRKETSSSPPSQMWR